MMAPLFEPPPIPQRFTRREALPQSRSSMWPEVSTTTRQRVGRRSACDFLRISLASVQPTRYRVVVLTSGHVGIRVLSQSRRATTRAPKRSDDAAQQHSRTHDEICFRKPDSACDAAEE